MSAPLIWLLPSARAAISRTRLVIDFDPGRAIFPVSAALGGTSLTAFRGLVIRRVWGKSFGLYEKMNVAPKRGFDRRLI